MDGWEDALLSFCRTHNPIRNHFNHLFTRHDGEKARVFVFVEKKIEVAAV